MQGSPNKSQSAMHWIDKLINFQEWIDIAHDIAYVTDGANDEQKYWLSYTMILLDSNRSFWFVYPMIECCSLYFEPLNQIGWGCPCFGDVLPTGERWCLISSIVRLVNLGFNKALKANFGLLLILSTSSCVISDWWSPEDEISEK